jgi:hypothetical protein
LDKGYYKGIFEKLKIKNILLALHDQLPLKRFVRNFCITRNAWGLFHINSHISARNGREKVGYPTKEVAAKAATAMSARYKRRFSAYKCIYCDGYHLGKNRDSK